MNRDRLTRARRSAPRPSDGRGIKGEGSKDRLSAERRSWNMSRIRGKDTSPELAVRSLLHRMGYRFRLHAKIPIPGRDAVLRRPRPRNSGRNKGRDARAAASVPPRAQIKGRDARAAASVPRRAQIKGRDAVLRRPRPRISGRNQAGTRLETTTRPLIVQPDIILPKYRVAIFVHGCFWHRHRGCKNCTTPTHRREWWVKKLEGNAARDKKHQRALRKLGWRVLY